MLAIGWLGCSAAAAQAIDPTIDERLEQTLPGPSAPLELDEAILTGREDIVLLKEREFFTVFVAASVTATSNPTLSNVSPDFDVVASINAGVRISTEIAETYRVGAEINAFAAQYAENDALEYTGFGLAFTADRSFGPYTLGARYAPQFVFSDDFSNHSVTLHRIDVFGARQFLLSDNVLIAPRLTLSGVPAEPADFSRVSGELALPVFYQPADGWLLSAQPRIYVQHYFDFFEQITGEPRTDVGGGISFSATYLPVSWLTLSATAGLALNHSTVRGLSYEALSVTPQVQAVVKF